MNLVFLNVRFNGYKRDGLNNGNMTRKIMEFKPIAPVSVNCCNGVGANVAGANGYEWRRWKLI